ncbi:Gfo/Idh/MocA family protein [Humisphaera borealis]|uniref:Gfo/Idh/MocA family protein n=1 Tax=Humisphaera borealis TaxID=2807512 RepID=UPI0019D1E253|nr:Gfo/Idh/MocA family oxidoreductase [Humisphaera borealis]
MTLHPPKTRIALVGAGNWGWQHARVFSTRADCQLVAVASRSKDRADERARQFGIAPYTDITTMCREQSPDLICVSLPNQAHFTPTLEVIRSGCPLFVEKPFVFHLTEADTLLAEAASRKLFFGINFNHRYAKPIALARQAIDAGKLGDIVFCHWRFGGTGGTDHPFNNLIETQCHALDMLEYLCGPIDSVMAEMTDKTKPGVYRTLVLALHFRNGAVGSLVGSYDSSYTYPGTHQLEINGTRGRVLVEETVKRFTFSEAGNETSQVWQAGYFNDRDRDFYQTFDAHAAAMIDARRNGQEPPVHARAGRRALLLAMAAIESFKGGKRVDVETDSWDASPPAPILAPPANP